MGKCECEECTCDECTCDECTCEECGCECECVSSKSKLGLCIAIGAAVTVGLCVGAFFIAKNHKKSEENN